MPKASIKVPSELFALAGNSRFEGELELTTLSVGSDDFHFAEPIAWNVEVTNTGGALLVVGTASGNGVCACARCLENVEFHFEGEIEGYFLIDGSASEDYHDKSGERLDDEFDLLSDDHIIDLEPLIYAALMVEAPQQPLCRDDCAGLCPTCGANLNESDCSCSRDCDSVEINREPNAFSVLASYSFDD